MYQQQIVNPTPVPGRSINTLIRVKGFWIAESIEDEPEIGVVLMCGTPIILCSLQKFQAEYSARPELASVVNTLAIESNYYIGEVAFYTDINITSSKVFCCALPEMLPTALQPLCENFNSFK